MARRMVLVDDLDNTESSDIKTLDFSLEGKPYEIDLSLKNASKLRDVLAPFIAAARRPTAPAKPKAAAVKTDKAQLDAIRTWARKQGHTVSHRGRIPQDIVDAFNSGTKTPAKKVATKAAASELVEA